MTPQPKLIAFDIDGTLLPHGEQRLSDDLLKEMKRLQDKGILLTAASGRQYPSLWRLFRELAKEMYFVAENGGAVLAPCKSEDMHDAEVLATTSIPRASALKLIEAFLSYPHAEILVSGVHCCYVFERAKPYVPALEKDWDVTLKILQNPEEIQEDIIKITAYTHIESPLVEKDFKEEFQTDFNVAVSGKKWLDFTVGNKALGLEKLAHQLGISLKEVMAFGDNYNDVEMLQEVGYPYLMESATEELKARFPNRCEKVIDILRTL